jgi:hypothetical protein
MCMPFLRCAATTMHIIYLDLTCMMRSRVQLYDVAYGEKAQTAPWSSVCTFHWLQRHWYWYNCLPRQCHCIQNSVKQANEFLPTVLVPHS